VVDSTLGQGYCGAAVAEGGVCLGGGGKSALRARTQRCYRDHDWFRTSASAASPVADIPPPPSPLQISVAISTHFLERACDNSVSKRARLGYFAKGGAM
jgi:hypothetical protein